MRIKKGRERKGEMNMKVDGRRKEMG